MKKPAEYAAEIEQEKQKLEERHLNGAGGMEISTALADFMDRLITGIFHETAGDAPQEGFALVALGGYGRGELNPQSDIDLLFLFDKDLPPGKDLPQIRIIPTLWDIGLKVGHSTRSVNDCVRIGQEDSVSKTSMIESRFLLGDRDLFSRYKRTMKKKVITWNFSQFIKEKRMETDIRHQKFQYTFFLTEPNVKESPGSLRDYQTALWVAAARFEVRTLDKLLGRGIISQRQHDNVVEAVDFLLRVRNDIHFQQKKPGDVLSYGLQPATAKRLGYEGKDEYAVPAMMENYYRAADDVYRFARNVTDQAKRYRSRAQLFFTKLRHREVADNIHAGPDEVYIKGLMPAELARRPATVFRVFREMALQKLALSNPTRRALFKVGNAWKEAPPSREELNKGFRSVIEVDDPYDAMRALRDTKILTSVIPEFHSIRYLTPFDLYHRYTVDEHTFIAMKEFDGLKYNDRPEVAPLRSLYQKETRKDIIRLAILFHDFGKGLKGTGLAVEDIDPAVITRMGYTREEADHIRRLVQLHLLMNMLAQRRDIYESSTITHLAEEAGDLTTLQRLYMLTFADTTAVGPDVWNNWKGILLKDLYRNTVRLFESAPVSEYPMERLGDKARAFVQQMPNRYLAYRIPADIERDSEYYHRFLEHDGPAAIGHRTWTDTEPGELIVVARDRRGLLSSLVGVLASRNVDILHSEIFTCANGVAVDIFRLYGHDGGPIKDSHMMERIEEDIMTVLGGTVNVEELMYKRERVISAPADLPVVRPSVKVINDEATEHTVIEVTALDRRGLLYDIAHALSGMELDIINARVSTEGHRAVNSFYVDDQHHKVIGEDRVDEIRHRLLERLESF